MTNIIQHQVIYIWSCTEETYVCVCVSVFESPEDEVSLPWQRILPWWYWRWCSLSLAHLGPHHSAPHVCGQLETEGTTINKAPSGDPISVKLRGCSSEGAESVSHMAECSCICSCFCSLLSGPLCDCRAACTLVAARSGSRKVAKGSHFNGSFPANS